MFSSAFVSHPEEKFREMSKAWKCKWPINSNLCHLASSKTTMLGSVAVAGPSTGSQAFSPYYVYVLARSMSICQNVKHLNTRRTQIHKYVYIMNNTYHKYIYTQYYGYWT